MIPTDIKERLDHFEQEVKIHFSFLTDYGYILDKTETGRTENFFEYFCNFYYKNGDTSVCINYNTDIINGHTIKFPQTKQKPVIDNIISSFITDKHAFMSIIQFVETKYPEIPADNFSIGINATNIKDEITRVVKNYSNFFRNHLVEVLKKEKIYECYTDRFYDDVFKEINYLHPLK